MGAMPRIYKSRYARYDPWLSYLIISLLFLMVMVTALSFRVYWFMREWGIYIAEWTCKEMVDSTVLAVRVVTEGWIDLQRNGWQYGTGSARCGQYGTGSACCDWRLDGLTNNWLTVRYGQCVWWLKAEHWQASEMELWANCQINVDSALLVRLDVLLASVFLALCSACSHTEHLHMYVAAASSHTRDTYMCSCSQFSHTEHLHM